MTDEAFIVAVTRGLTEVMENVRVLRHTDVDQDLTLFQIQARRPGDFRLTCLSAATRGGVSCDGRDWAKLYDRLADDLEEQLDRTKGEP